jgi:murein DD-endopeptidase MepM/ murein hydrolase activator NlpD
VVQLPPTPTAIDLAPVAPSDYTVELGTTPSLRDYYQRSLRPPGRLGNGNISLLFPLAIPAPITSAFGWRLHPISGDRRFHSGTDIGAPMGTPVLAAYAGQVAIADFLGGYGLTVTVNHNQGSQTTLYGHLSEVFVKPGEMVQQGTVIGRVGSTGNSTGPHLHFEFRQLTPDGWTVMDAGTQLEYSLTQLVKALQTGQPLATGTIAGEAKFRASLQVEAKLSRSLQKTAITPLPTARN